ncbi:MAG: hypothetical protein DSM106950_41670 [Stigonema ocellatum SAG 48.90 = DSM 106950]|nr:hypothetical protein [Stigonema ocellatum SAG 48.90 = DSM 106950]
MASRQRKTLVVCRQCHMEIHAGQVTQRTTTDMETRSLPGTLKSVSPVWGGADRKVLLVTRWSPTLLRDNARGHDRSPKMPADNR